MAGFSRVTLMGNLCRDPELRSTTSGNSVCDITVAVNQGRGESKKTAFVMCTFWRKLAETVAAHFTKGKPIIVHGELSMDEWKDKDSGEKRSRIKVMASGFDFLPRQAGDKADSEDGPDHSREYAPSASKDDLEF